MNVPLPYHYGKLIRISSLLKPVATRSVTFLPDVYIISMQGYHQGDIQFPRIGQRKNPVVPEVRMDEIGTHCFELAHDRGGRHTSRLAGLGENPLKKSRLTIDQGAALDCLQR